MTSYFILAAVFLGAEPAVTEDALDLQQPVIAQEVDAMDLVLGNVSVRGNEDATNTGIIKPVGYESKNNLPPVIRVSDTKPVSILVRQTSPSDGPSAVAPPVPAVPKPMSAGSMQAPSNNAPHGARSSDSATILGTDYYATEDYSAPGCGDCADSCEAGCSHGCGCAAHGFGFNYWGKHCLPSPWHAPGNMMPHIPYVAYPKTYYYFRPYNMLHIPRQQAQAATWVSNPALPYSNEVFAGVYEELEPVLNPKGEIVE